MNEAGQCEYHSLPKRPLMKSLGSGRMELTRDDEYVSSLGQVGSTRLSNVDDDEMRVCNNNNNNNNNNKSHRKSCLDCTYSSRGRHRLDC